ncbi:hypothetical protein H9P43_004727 [Blastocladiella emersonii ATCC 22665]|nr:hypothetical protein H9P43_004727 [Blastocladiella emersonii ATCC 22665]
MMSPLLTSVALLAALVLLASHADALFVPLTSNSRSWSLSSIPPSSHRADSDHGRGAAVVASVLARMRNATSPLAYCQASVPSAAEYAVPRDAATGEPMRLAMVQLYSRHGDRSPENVLRDDVNGNVAWECSNAEFSFLDDTSRAAGSGPQPGGASGGKSKGGALLTQRVTDHTRQAWQPRTWGGNCAQGELTAKGRAMMIDFGRSLRELYVDELGLLSPTFDPSEVHVRSTDISRTIHSAQSLIDGLFPRTSMAEGTLNYVNIHTQAVAVDPLHSNKLDEQCPRLMSIQAAGKTTDVWHAFLAASLRVRATVETVAPLKTARERAVVEAPSKKGVPSVTENILCRRCWDKPQPCVPAATVRRRVRAMMDAEDDRTTRRALAGLLKSLHTHTTDNGEDEEQVCLDEATVDQIELFKSFDFWYRNNYVPNKVVPEIVGLEMGPLLREMDAAFDAKDAQDGDAAKASNNPAKLFVYLTHDGTVSGMLGALRASPEHHVWPAYRSNLAVEVWTVPSTGERRVRVLHDGKPFRTDADLAAPCSLGDASCPLDVFRADLRARSVADWEAACTAPAHDDDEL